MVILVGQAEPDWAEHVLHAQTTGEAMLQQAWPGWLWVVGDMRFVVGFVWGA